MLCAIKNIRKLKQIPRNATPYRSRSEEARSTAMRYQHASSPLFLPMISQPPAPSAAHPCVNTCNSRIPVLPCRLHIYPSHPISLSGGNGCRDLAQYHAVIPAFRSNTNSSHQPLLRSPHPVHQLPTHDRLCGCAFSATPESSSNSTSDEISHVRVR